MAEAERAESTSAEMQEHAVDTLRNRASLARKQLLTALMVILALNILVLLAMVVLYFTRLRAVREAHMIQRSPEMIQRSPGILDM